MSRLALLLALAVFGGCVRYGETLRPAAPPHVPAIQAKILRPDGAGPFPAMIILHGCAGPLPNAERWGAMFRDAGLLVAIPDQHGPRGVDRTCEGPDPRMGSHVRLRDTYDLMRILAARPDVRADSIFLMGFSFGHYVTVSAMTPNWEGYAPFGEAPLRPRAGIAVYGICAGLPQRLHGPLLLVLPELDDWAPAADCQRWASVGWRGEPAPRILLLEGAYHDFDFPERVPPRFVPSVHNPSNPRGFGATLAYDAQAYALARREVLAFVRAELARTR